MVKPAQNHICHLCEGGHHDACVRVPVSEFRGTLAHHVCQCDCAIEMAAQEHAAQDAAQLRDELQRGPWPR